MRRFIIAAMALASLGAPAFGATAHHHTTPVHSKPAALACPVTGIKIASPAKAAGHSTYKRKTYYFCCPMCKPKFDKNPQHYIDNAKHGHYDKM